MTMTPAPTRLRVLDDDGCLCLLGTHPVGRIGFSASALPVIMPINFTLDGRTIFFRTEPGLKLDAARAGVVACLEVDGYDTITHAGWSVLATGRLHLVADPDRVDLIATLPLAPWASPHAPYLVEMPVELLSGRAVGESLPPSS